MLWRWKWPRARYQPAKRRVSGWENAARGWRRIDQADQATARRPHGFPSRRVASRRLNIVDIGIGTGRGEIRRPATMQMTSRPRRLAVVAAMTSRASSTLAFGRDSRGNTCHRHASFARPPTIMPQHASSFLHLRNNNNKNDWIPLGLRRMEERRLQTVRGLSTAMAVSAELPFDPKSFDPADESIPPLSPSQFYTDDGQIPMPKALSPSAILEFQKCPQSYLFQYLFGLRQGTTEALARGTFCHTALENVFDLIPEERTLENLHNLFRKAWSEERLSDGYRALFEERDNGDITARNLDAEISWGKSALALLDNYYQLEDPRSVPVPNPLAREIWVSSELMSDRGDKFLVRGIVDRVDLINGPFLRIVDYKTGKCPDFKYSPATNERIAHESFFQLKIYALLLREMMRKQQQQQQQADEDSIGDIDDGNSKRRKSNGLPQNLRAGIPVRNLRLLYLTSKDAGPAKYLDCDLGATEEARNAELDQIQGDIGQVWSSITDLVEGNDPRAFVHCDRAFCWCHKVRPRFIPQTVWHRQPPSGNSS